MVGLRMIVIVFLFAGMTQNFGEIHADTNTQEGRAPDSRIKGHLLTVAEGCGSPKPEPMNRIVGGGAARDGAWPWMVQMGVKTETDLDVFCAGSLITSRHVLSVAHCFEKIQFNTVRLGAYDWTNKNEKHVDVAIKSFKVHEYYEASTIINDIAMVYLANDVEFTDRIRPICLPTSKEMQSRSFVNTNPFVAGWGRLGENSSYPKILQQVQLPVIGNDECKKYYRDNGALKKEEEYRLNEEYVLCAGLAGGGRSACEGDSGGPMMLPIFENGRFPYYQIGIVSYGYGCEKPNSPGMFTNVQKYVGWIMEKLY